MTGTLGFLPRPFFFGTAVSFDSPDFDNDEEELEGVGMMGAPCAVGEGGTDVMMGNGAETEFDVGVDGVALGVDGPCAVVGVVGIEREGGGPEGEGRLPEELKDGDIVGLTDGLLSSPFSFFGLPGPLRSCEKYETDLSLNLRFFSPDSRVSFVDSSRSPKFSFTLFLS